MHLPSIQTPCVHLDPEIRHIDDESFACLGFEAMGCRFEILVEARLPSLSLCDCKSIAEEMRELVLDWHNRLSIFHPHSITSQINRTEAGQEILLDQDMYSLCELCDQLRVSTNGVFNIAAGTLMHAHGFRSTSADDSAIEDLDLSEAFTLDKGRGSIMKLDDRIMLDFGAIAKGFVLDLIREELVELGVANAFVHGGTSSILAIGSGPKSRPWISAAGQQHAVNLSGYSAGVSEIYSREVIQGGRKVGHVMDPRTKVSMESTVSRVVCVHQSAAVADAYSTACCVSPQLADRLSSDPCSIIVFDVNNPPTLHDPLGVVSKRLKNHT